MDLMLYRTELLRYLDLFTAFFSKHGIRWYIQGSLAVRIYGVVERNVTDLDLRVDASLDVVLELIKAELFPTARMRSHVKFARGEFRNECVLIDMEELGTHIDITNKITTYRNDLDLEFDIPFCVNPSLLPVCSNDPRRFPVCSLNGLLINKCIHSRGSDERKNDMGEVVKLLPRLSCLTPKGLPDD